MLGVHFRLRFQLSLYDVIYVEMARHQTHRRGKSLNSNFAFFRPERVSMARRGEENAGLPSFFQDNPWLDILAQRGAEPAPDFVASEAPSTPAVSRATPVIEPEPIASSPTTTPTATPLQASFPRELVVRLKVPPEFVEAIRELKEAIIMALSVSQRQTTVIPIHIPISVAQVAPQFAQAPVLAQDIKGIGLLCPKCGRPGRLIRSRRGRRTYILVLHGRQKCYLGPEEKVREKWPQLLERSLVESAQHLRALNSSPGDLWAANPVLPACQTRGWASFGERVVDRPGFEPGTSAMPTRRSTRLIYRPTVSLGPRGGL